MNKIMLIAVIDDNLDVAEVVADSILNGLPNVSVRIFLSPQEAIDSGLSFDFVVADYDYGTSTIKDYDGKFNSLRMIILSGSPVVVVFGDAIVIRKGQSSGAYINQIIDYYRLKLIKS